MAMVNTMISNFPNVKDSRWLTLEVCREYTRNKCTRQENECKYAHPPPHVEVQNGRVTCCFDSIKGKCQRKDPLCKYLHPPQHLREQLLQNGRNNLIMRNIQMSLYASNGMPPVMPGMMQTVMYDTTGGGKQVSYPAAAATATPQVLPGQYPVVEGSPMVIYPQAGRNGMTHPYLTAVPTTMPPHLAAPYMGITSTSQGLIHNPPVDVMANHAAPAVGTSPVPVSLTQKMPRTDRLEPSASSVSTLSNGSESSSSGSSGWAGSYIDTAAITQATPSQQQYSPLYFQPQVVEVLTAGKKRPRDPGDDYVLGVPAGVHPMIPVKRQAVDNKSGLPMYQPIANQSAYLAAMHLQQPAFVPGTQITGHAPSMQRF